MLTANPANSQQPPTETGPIEQLLVMHCLKEDSVLGREGFGVRAASPGATDQQTLEWVHKLEQYELPLDMKTGALLSNQAPRRLALVPGPPGRVALIHTAYLPEDTVGRSHSFISQVLLVPELGTIAAVSAWGSSDWQTSEYARGETKVLPTLENLPRGLLIEDAALTAFLSGASAPADQSLARTIYPGRVESNLEARKRWVRAALQGFLRAGEPNATRARVCILAEPGVVALLVYAIARLLPPQITESFPFSTYEPPHTTLRENKVARVIGGYARNGLDRGEFDSLGRKGYVVDTFRDVHGPDLLVDSSWPLEGLLKLVSDGDWNSVDEIRDLWVRDTRPGQAAAASLSDALRVRPLAAALKVGTLGAEGLLELKRNRFGEALFRDDDLRRPAWECLRKVWSRPSIRDAFTDTLREHLDELLGDVRARVEAGPSGAWREGWEALKPVLPPERRVEELTRLLAVMEKTATSLPMDERASLLAEWSLAAPPSAAVPASLHWLARAANPDEFRTLVGSPKVNARVVGLAASLALSGSAEWGRDPGFLKDLPEDRFHAFVSELPNFELRKAVYERLRSHEGAAKTLVDRLIRLRARLPEKCAEEVLSAIGCDEPAWRQYWSKNECAQFGALLKILPPDSPLARRLWDGVLAGVTADNFVDGQASNIGPLVELAKRFPDSFSREQKARLDSWNEVNLEFAEPPKSATPGKALSLANACRAIGVAPADLAQSWFRAHVMTAKKPVEMKDRAGKFGRSIVGFYDTADAACEQALKLADEVETGDLCRVCKTELFSAIASEESRDRLARRFDYALRETDIRPNSSVDSRQSGKRTTGGGKGLGIGRLRLPAKATPFLMTFLAGGLFFGVVLFLVPPMFAHVMTNLTDWWNATELAKVKKERTELRTELKLMTADLQTAQGEIAKQPEKLTGKDHEIEDLNRRLIASDAALNEAKRAAEIAKQQTAIVTPPPGADPGGTAPQTTQSGQQGSPKPPQDTESLKTRLNALILDQPLTEENFPRARELALDLQKSQPATPLGDSDRLATSILSNLSVHSVPRDIFVKNPDSITEAAQRMDFAFVGSATKDQLAIATLQPGASHPLTVYFLNLAADRIWENQLKSTKLPAFTAMSCSAAARFFLLGAMGNGIDPDYTLISCAQFYSANVSKDHLKPPGWSEAPLSLPSRVGMKPAFSDDGRLCAFAESESGRSSILPNVTICAANPASKWELKLDFEPIRNDLSPGWRIAGISFDTDARSVVVGFTDKKFLLGFALPDPPPPADSTRPRPNRIELKGPPLGWAHASNGKFISIVSDGSTIIEGFLSAWCANPVNSPKRLFDDHSTRSSCVAFAPKGTLLAVGDRRGVISVRSLTTLNPVDDLIRGKVVMRIQSPGPVHKLAFSPDGRVLAALAPTFFNTSDDRLGVIRLWTTENWELLK